MTKKYFGTDGIQGRVGKFPITPDFIMHLGYSDGKALATVDWHLTAGKHPTVLVGKNTRVSGYMLESALEAGLCADGVDVLISGPMSATVTYVLELLQQKEWQLGGKNSGHIICMDKHTTGDGIISALQVLYALRNAHKALAEFMRGVSLYPQRLTNIKISKSFSFNTNKAVNTVRKEAEADLNGNERLLSIRASGTEPLIRVMVESRFKQKVNYWTERITETVQIASTEWGIIFSRVMLIQSRYDAQSALMFQNPKNQAW